MKANASGGKKDYFYFIMSIVIAFCVVLGFGNTYGHRLIVSEGPIPTVIHLHAAIFSCWILLFMVQCFLILKKKIGMHIRAGQVGVILALVMLISGVMTALVAAREGHLGIPGVMFPTPEGFLLLNFASAFLFALYVFCGWANRSELESHKRFMLMATVAGLAPPAISRMPLLSGSSPLIAVAVLLIIAIGPLRDLKQNGRVHSAYKVSLPFVLLILPPVVEFLASTQPWRWLAALMI